MSLINLKDLLNNAKQNKYAVGAFNITNLASIDYMVDAAKEQQSPIILQVGERLEVFGSKGMCAPEKTLCFSSMSHD